jgi:hypothetical protein
LYHKRIYQLLLRVIAIILLYLFVTNFSLKIKTRITPSLPILLVDYSPSVRNYLHEVEEIISNLNFRYQTLFFSDTIYVDKNNPKGRFTNITAALATASNLFPSAIILISDGNHNSGPSPIDVLEEFRTPVYCFSVGNKETKDQAIVDVLYPEYAFQNDTISIEVIVETGGMTERNGRISLKSNSINIEKDFQLTRELTRRSIEFRFVARKEGEERYNISLLPQVAETNYENNEKVFSIGTFDRKISVLYYTDHPSFNTPFIKECLKDNNNLEFSDAIRISDGKLINAGRLINEETINLAHFDIIIFDNFNVQNLPQGLREFLNKDKGILITGSIRGTSEVLNEILPFQTNGTQLEQELPIKVLSPFSVFSPLENYAPISKINRIIGINSQTTLLAKAGDIPLLGYRKINSSAVFQINIPDLGVWHFAQLNLNHREILKPLLEEIMRFLSPYGRNQRLILTALKQQYHTGELVSFHLKRYDRNLNPGSGGDFYLEFGEKKIPFFETRSGIYEVTFRADTAGEFSVFACGILQNDTLKSNSLKLNIIDVKSEPEEIVNTHLLKKISEETGGGYYELSELMHFQPPQMTDYYETKTFFLDQPVFYIVIFCLVVFVWIIRKKNGLI